jgi:hypothetical protein
MSRRLCRDGRTTEPQQKRTRCTNECEDGECQNKRNGQVNRCFAAECTEPIEALLLLHMTGRRGKCLMQSGQQGHRGKKKPKLQRSHVLCPLSRPEQRDKTDALANGMDEAAA